MTETGETKIKVIITICIILITISFIGCLDDGGEGVEKKDGKEKTTKNQPPIIELICPKTQLQHCTVTTLILNGMHQIQIMTLLISVLCTGIEMNGKLLLKMKRTMEITYGMLV